MCNLCQGTRAGKSNKEFWQATTSARDRFRKVESNQRLPYELGGVGAAPGVCQLPGPLAKRNWPDRDKYKNVKQVPGMCQLCSTVCGIVGHVKDGRLIKIEGNPNDPNSRGHLCGTRSCRLESPLSSCARHSPTDTPEGLRERSTFLLLAAFWASSQPGLTHPKATNTNHLFSQHYQRAR